MHNAPTSIFRDTEGNPIEGSWIAPDKQPWARAWPVGTSLSEVFPPLATLCADCNVLFNRGELAYENGARLTCKHSKEDEV